jgi:hypothetical protein
MIYLVGSNYLISYLDKHATMWLQQVCSMICAGRNLKKDAVYEMIKGNDEKTWRWVDYCCSIGPLAMSYAA